MEYYDWLYLPLTATKMPITYKSGISQISGIFEFGHFLNRGSFLRNVKWLSRFDEVENNDIMTLRYVNKLRTIFSSRNIFY